MAAAGTLAGTGDGEGHSGASLGSAAKGLVFSRGSRTTKHLKSVPCALDAAPLRQSPSFGDFMAKGALQWGLFHPLCDLVTWTSSQGSTGVGPSQPVPSWNHPQPLDKPERFFFFFFF